MNKIEQKLLIGLGIISIIFGILLITTLTFFVIIPIALGFFAVWKGYKRITRDSKESKITYDDDNKLDKNKDEIIEEEDINN